MNLIVTCSRHLESEASDEISRALGELGDLRAQTSHSRFSGIVMVDTSLDPFQVVDRIRTKILEEPWSVRHCHRFIPLQESTGASIAEIASAVERQVKVMQPGDTYRITVEKRGSKISTKELIDTVATNIGNKVSLEEYDWNITIEILGNVAGISVLKDHDIISTLKLKRDSME